jgi:hypothetical protein
VTIATQQEDTVEAEDALTMNEQLRKLAEPAPSLAGGPSLPDKVKDRFVTVDILALEPDPANAREHLTDIEALADNILANGLKQTPLVRKKRGKWYLAEGHRRHAALQLLVKRGHTEWRYIAAQVEDRNRSSDLEALKTMLSANRQRVPLDPIEEGRLWRAWMRGAKIATYEEAAEVIGGVHPTTIRTRCMLIDDLTTAEQQEVRMGTLGVVAAVDRVRARRKAERGREAPVVRPPRPAGAGDAPIRTPSPALYFGPGFRLETEARMFCNRADHKAPFKYGGIACGPCIDAVIAEEARRKTREEVLEELSTPKGATGAAARKARVDHRINMAAKALGAS